MKIFKHKAFTIVWTILRVWLGYKWLTAGVQKLTNPAWVGSEAGTAIQGFQEPLPGPQASMLRCPVIRRLY